MVSSVVLSGLVSFLYVSLHVMWLPGPISKNVHKVRMRHMACGIPDYAVDNL